MRLKSQRQSERGAVLIESALSFLLFFMMFIGVIDFARVMYYHQTLTERARAAARYAAIHPTESAGIKNVAVYNNAAANGTTSATLSGLTLAMVNVQNLDINTPSARVVVTISGYPMDFMTPGFAGAFRSKPITAVMASETQVP